MAEDLDISDVFCFKGVRRLSQWDLEELTDLTLSSLIKDWNQVDRRVFLDRRYLSLVVLEKNGHRS